MLRKRVWKLLAAAVATAMGTIAASSNCAVAQDVVQDATKNIGSVADAYHPLQLVDEVESVYDLEAPPAPDAGINEGGVSFDLTVRYVTDYVFRGIDRGEGNGGFNDSKGRPVNFDPTDTNFKPGAEDAANLQVDTRVKFDLGRLPSPVIGLFSNVYNDDPISRFQEIRPFVGLEWMIRPFIIGAGNTTYIFPERDSVNTSEIYLSVTLDDSFLFNAEHPVLSPYVFAAYDYDLYNGFYVEAGVKHEIPIEDTPLSFTLLADVAFVGNDPQFTRSNNEDTGFQHYDLGLIGHYNLNTLFNISKRYGSFSLEGYLYYTDGMANDLLADTQLWGGLGIAFKY